MGDDYRYGMSNSWKKVPCEYSVSNDELSSPIQPERSKREDFAKSFKIWDRALKRAHAEGAWDQEDYDAMYELVKEAKMRCSELMTKA